MLLRSGLKKGPGQLRQNLMHCGVILKMSSSGKSYSPIQSGTIPEGYVYVCGSHPDSFDSRYAEFGLIRVENIREKLWPLF